MRARAKIVGLAVLTASVVVVLPSAPAAGVASWAVCAPRSAVKTGNVSWQLRQASGLAVLPGYNMLFTHNDRGIKDSPGPNEDVTAASVWAISTSGAGIARFRLLDRRTGTPISYFDTEAISVDYTASPPRIVLADTGTNVDGRTTVAIYSFALPSSFSPNQPPSTPVPTIDVAADVIPIEYYNKATGGSPVKLNVETFTIDRLGNAFFVARTATLPYSYKATKSALTAAAGTSNPARAVRSVRLVVDGPMTDASISPDATMMLVKTMTDVYAYDLTSAAAPLDATSWFGQDPCLVASASNASSPGYGEAIVARNDGGFYTLAEGAKGKTSGTSSAVWNFSL
jgi:hypothetical protein